MFWTLYVTQNIRRHDYLHVFAIFIFSKINIWILSQTKDLTMQTLAWGILKVQKNKKVDWYHILHNLFVLS